MKRIIAMMIMIAGVIILGLGVNSEGQEEFSETRESVARQEINERRQVGGFNLGILAGIIVTMGGVILYFSPNLRQDES